MKSECDAQAAYAVALGVDEDAVYPVGVVSFELLLVLFQPDDDDDEDEEASFELLELKDVYGVGVAFELLEVLETEDVYGVGIGFLELLELLELENVYGVGVAFFELLELLEVLESEDVYGVGVVFQLEENDEDEDVFFELLELLVEIHEDVVSHLLPAGLVIVVTTVLLPTDTVDSGQGVSVVYVLRISVDCSQVWTFVVVDG